MARLRKIREWRERQRGEPPAGSEGALRVAGLYPARYATRSAILVTDRDGASWWRLSIGLEDR
jgi:hypothetical protein